MAKVRERMIPDEKGSAFWLQLHLGRYIFAAQFVGGKAVLDIACGNGYGSGYLMNKGARNIVGADYSKEAIEYAQRHYQRAGVHFLRCDAQQMPFDDSAFDVVVSLETIEHLERYEDFVKECRRVLKDSGTFICSTPNRKVTFGSRDPYHFREFSVEEFHELTERYLADVELYGQDFMKRADILKRELLWRAMPAIRVIPQSIKAPIRRLLLPEDYPLSLAEIDPGFEGTFDQTVDGRHVPSLLGRDSHLPATIVAVARKRDE